MAGGSPLSLDNALFRTFIGHASLVILKIFFVTLVIVYHRVTKGVFANPEDLKFKSQTSKKGVILNDPDVERARRNHLNDLENVIPFVLLGLIYITIGPDPSFAVLHFRIFTISRFIHTIVYLLKVPQPSRLLACFAGFLVNLSLCCQILKHATF